MLFVLEEWWNYMEKKNMEELFSSLVTLNGDKLREKLKDFDEFDFLDAKGVSPLLFCIKSKLYEKAIVLIESGADPNFGIFKGDKALFHAIQNKHYELVKTLVAHGALLDQTFTTGQSALDLLETSDDLKLEEALFGNSFDMDEDSEQLLDSFEKVAKEQLENIDLFRMEQDDFFDIGEGEEELLSLDALEEYVGTQGTLPSEERKLAKSKVKIFRGDIKGKGEINHQHFEKTDENPFDMGFRIFKNTKQDMIINDYTDGSPFEQKKENDSEAKHFKGEPIHKKGELNNKITTDHNEASVKKVTPIKKLKRSIAQEKKSALFNRQDPQWLLEDSPLGPTATQKIKAFMIRGQNIRIQPDEMKDIFDLLAEFKNSDGQNSLMLAAQVGNLDFVRYFINNGMKPNTKDFLGNSPLIYAVATRHDNVAQYLIEKGAKVSEKNSQGYTPLYYALKNNDSTTFNILLKNGANTQIRINGSPILTIATRKRMHEFVELLVLHNANPKTRDNKFNKPLDYAQRKKDLKLIRILEYAEKRFERDTKNKAA